MGNNIRFFGWFPPIHSILIHFTNYTLDELTRKKSSEKLLTDWPRAFWKKIEIEIEIGIEIEAEVGQSMRHVFSNCKCFTRRREEGAILSFSFSFIFVKFILFLINSNDEPRIGRQPILKEPTVQLHLFYLRNSPRCLSLSYIACQGLDQTFPIYFSVTVTSNFFLWTQNRDRSWINRSWDTVSLTSTCPCLFGAGCFFISSSRMVRSDRKCLSICFLFPTFSFISLFIRRFRCFRCQRKSLE